jgi:tetratricopeptide (TPR) repeat protein
MGSWSKQARIALSNRDYVQAGDFYKLDGSYKAAVKAYLKGKAFGQAAKMYEDMGQIPKAQTLLEKNGSPQELADFHRRHHNTDAAIATYEANQMYFEAAELNEQVGNLLRAAQLYEKQNFLEKAGVLYGKTKNFDEAIRTFERLIASMSSEDTPAIRGRIHKYRDWIANLHVGAKRFSKAGDLFKELNQFDKAAKAYLKAGNHIAAAEIFYQDNRLEDAKRALKGVESLDSRRMLGKIAMDLGNLQEAATLLKGTEEHELLAQINEQIGRFSVAGMHREKLGDLRSAAQLYGRGGDFKRAALILEQEGQYQEAAEFFEKLKKFGYAAKLYHMARNRLKAGECLYQIKRSEDALKQLQLIDDAAQEYPEAQRLMSRIFFDQGNIAPARDLLEQIVTKATLDDQNILYFYMLARCYEEEGNLPSAKKYYERIVTRRVDYNDANFRLKRLTSQMGSQPVDQSSTHHTATSTLLKRGRNAEFTSGDLIANRFRVIETIGKGGMGYIYKVRDLSLDRDIALKMLLHDRGNFEELKTELITARDLTHPFIIKVFDIGEWMNVGYFTMENVDGKPLKKWIVDEIGMPVDEKVKLVIQICQGLKHAHDQGVVHRDIKPQNIIITLSGQPKILDFGIARRVNQKKDKSISGSPKYMAPEQIHNTGIDKRTDIYAMGIIMFYMFTGKEPFVARTAHEIMMMQLEKQLPDPHELNATLPNWLVEIIKRCCHKNQEMRYGSMEELIEELELNLLDIL